MAYQSYILLNILFIPTHEFNPWTRRFAFHVALINTPGKVMNVISLPPAMGK